MEIKADLKPCPFCGSATAHGLASICECEMCGNFEEEDCPECYTPTHSDGCMHIVVCNVNRGGCGASTGWCINGDKAIEAWNSRTERKQDG